jgi:hypothetical protein
MISSPHRRTAFLMLAGALPLLGLIYLTTRLEHRSAENLAVADRCVNWAHKSRDVRALDGPEIAAVCDRYFRVRSDKDADEDDRRWQQRTGGTE